MLATNTHTSRRPPPLGPSSKTARCGLYREGGAGALGPKSKGGPRGSKARPRVRAREQGLEERCRRLETEVVYLKKLRALVERDGL